MLNSMGAGFVLKAYDAATPVVKRVGGAFGWLRRQTGKMTGGMNRSLGSLATGFMALHAGLGMIKLAKEAGDAAGKFQQGLVGVGQIARATADEMVMLRKAAIDAALVTKFSPDEAVEGLQTLAAQGLRATEAATVLVPALELATGSLGQLGIAGAADAVVGSLKSMGVELSNAADYTDKLLKITQMTNFQTRDFEVALGRATSSAKLYGQTFEDTLITLGLIRNMNIDASVASTSLREAWRRLASDENAQQAVQKHGIDIFDKRTGKIRDMLGIMIELGAKTAKLTDKERMRMVTIAFGVRGMAAYNAVLNATYTVMKDGEPIVLKGKSAVNAMRYELSRAGETLTDVQKSALAAELGVSDLSQVMKTSIGVSKEYRDALLDTYEGQKQLITGAWSTLLVVIGEDFAKAMKPFANAIYEAITAVALFVNSMSPEAKQMIFKFVVALGALITLGGGLTLLSGVLGMLGGSIIGVVWSIAKLVLIGVPALMLLSGMGIGLKALAQAFKIGGKDGLSFEKVMKNVRLALSGMMSIMTGEGFSDDLKKEFEKAENQGVVKFLGKFTTWLGRIRVFWRGLKSGFEQGVAMLAQSSAFKRLQGKLEGIIKIFTGGDSKNTTEVLDEWQRRGEAAGVALTRLGESAAGAIEKLIDFGSSFAEFIGNISADDVRAAITSFVDAFRELGNALNFIKTFFLTIYGLVRLILSAVAELVLGIGNFAGAIIGIEGARGGGWFDKENWTWTADAAKGLVETERGRLDYVKERERDDAEAAERERKRVRIRDLEVRKGNIEQWIGTSTEDFHAGGARKGQKAFGEAGAKMQQQFQDELKGIKKQLEKLTSQPVIVNMNGEKVAEIVGKQPSMTGEDSLDDTAAVAAF